MRPQTIFLTAAICLTGLFVAGVAGVIAWQNLPTDLAQQPDVVRNFQQAVQAPIAGFDVPAAKEQPLPPAELARQRGPVVAANDCTISGPHTHGNLTVFLIHGQDTLKDANVLTLQEALEQNVATVHDRGFTLAVDNRGNAPLFIQAGDIVKGGNQDRTIPHDMLVLPQTNGAATPALCVEEGRSSRRGNEEHRSFQVASEQLPSRTLKLAAYRGSQRDVWSNVRLMQDNLTRNAGGSVLAIQSQTSLQLTLEHPRVQEGIQAYLTNLAPAIEGKNDAIGYAVVVNGKIQSADVYASSALFQKLWPKLIRASAIDALAERRAGVQVVNPDAAAIQAFLKNAEQGQATRLDTASRSVVLRQETGQHLLHDTCVPSQGNLVLHRNFLTK